MTTVAGVCACSILFAGGLLFINSRMEQITFGNMVSGQLNHLLEHQQADAALTIDRLPGWQFYQGQQLDSAPAALRTLATGTHHSVRVGDAYLEVAVADIGQERVLLSYDITAWEAQEHAVFRFLAYGVGVLLLVAILVARITARSSLRPLRALTDRLAIIQPNARNLQIAADFQGHEVGTIAREFDRYLKRLDDFVEREKFFSAAASHELRTPLSIIMGAVDVLESREPDPGSVRALARIKRACRDMLAFIEATLFLAREEGQFAEDQGETPLHTIVAELLEDLQGLLTTHNIRVISEVSDRFQLRQPPSVVKMVLGNLLRNAIEHTRDGEIRIAETEVGIMVSDTGEGISRENLERVFDLNFSSKPGGVGMGLSLLQKICDRVGWSIQLQSIEGEGTSAILTFIANPFIANHSGPDTAR